MKGVYKIDFGTNKFYVGSSIDIRKRKLNHLSQMKRGTSNCKLLQKAFNKYGLDKFNFTIIELTENIRGREMFWINKTDSVNNGYNIALDTSIPMLGRKHSKETKKLMSEKAKGNKGRFGQKLSPEHLINLSKAKIGVLTGRSFNVGAANAGAKLTGNQAQEILDAKGKFSQVKLAKLYNVSQTTIWKIHNRIKWKQLKGNLCQQS